MKKETLREKIVRLTKEYAECEDEQLCKKLKRQIQFLKSIYPDTETQSLGNLMSKRDG